ncbi:MAG: C10 family peptidase [Muribaculaceae bacterium]|nr:C10 family peptidase [Muribaculaceae bacterium]
MKKKLFLSALLSVSAIGLMAAPVSKERAVKTAETYIASRTGATVKMASVYQSTDAYYIVNLAPQGWVIVSADDNASPVIGYSTSGQLSWHSIPENMNSMLVEYGAQVKELAAKTKVANRRWNSVNLVSATRDEESSMISPLISVHWNQTAPFNYYCPGQGNTKAIVGCVAVSMSQAMSVQKYPPRPTGYMDYTPPGYSNIRLEYDGETPYDWNAILAGSNQYREAARLMYHAGVSVKMHYGADGSGVPYNDLYLIRDALRDIFQYGSGVSYYYREQYEASFGKQAWVRLMLNELAAGRAIVYNGTGTAGHSFNVDGYDGSMFHLNWGWGGIGDGYFQLDKLYDEYQGISFPNNHIAVIGIGSPDRELRSIELDAMSIEEDLEPGAVVANVTVNGTTPKPVYKLEALGVFQNGVRQDIPFEIVNNQLVTTKKLSAATKASYDIDVRVTTSVPADEPAFIQSFTITVQTWQPIDQATSVSYDRATGNFEFKTKHGASYTLRSAAGATLASGSLNNLPRFTINKATLAAGKNTLEIRRGNEVKTLTLIK